MFFRSTFFIFPLQPLECKIFINKINIIIFINVVFLMKKIQDSNILIWKKSSFYNTKILCHHVEHILFYLWLKHESIWTNIVIPINSFSIKLRMGQHSWNMFKVMFNHSNHKQSQPFQSQRMWVSNEKINEPK
jgi:hypothetical protein